MNSNYGWGLPVAASTVAGDIDRGLWIIHIAMALIFVVWGIFFTYLLIRYRRKEGVPAERQEEQHGLRALLPDLAVLTFEIALVVFYAIPVWARIKMTFPESADANHVAIIAEQFAWNVHYPGADGKFGRRDIGLVHFSNPIGLDKTDPAAADDIVTANELHMPLGKPTLIDLSAKDVIHSFFVPEFRVKQDAVPGMMIPVWVEPTLEGTFEIGCAQLCGFGHALMRGDAIVHQPAAFEAWAKGAAPEPAGTDTTPDW